MKTIKVLTLSVFVICLFLFYLNLINKFIFKKNYLQLIFHSIFLFNIALIIIWNYKYLRNCKNHFKKSASVLFMTILILLFLLGTIIMIFGHSQWKTQEKIAKSRNKRNYYIEFQMQDIGILGYRSRIVTAFYITKDIIVTKKIESEYWNIHDYLHDENNWEIIDMEINEMGFDTGY